MKPKRESTTRDRRRGSTMVEFSLVFVIFVFMIFGVFEAGRTLWTFHTLTHAAKQGARYAMVHGSRNPLAPGAKSIDQFVKEQAVGVDSQLVTVGVTYTPTSDPGNLVTVTADYSLPLVVGRLVGLGSNISIRGASTKTIVN